MPASDALSPSLAGARPAPVVFVPPKAAAVAAGAAAGAGAGAASLKIGAAAKTMAKAKMVKKTVGVTAAAMAGTTETLAMYPMDAIKTRLQLQGAQSGMLTQLRDMIEQRAVYRGIASPLSCDPFKRAIKFAFFESYLASIEALYAEHKGGRFDGAALAFVGGPAKKFLAGGLAGLTETLFECPFENVKCKLQAGQNMRTFSGPLHCASVTFAEGGVAPFYNGLAAHACRNGIWNGTYFGIIGAVTSAMGHSPDDSFAASLLKKFVAGAIGGSAGTVLNTPFDVVKSRIQANAQLRTGAAQMGVFETMANIARTEGPGQLYRGLDARFIRLGLGGGIMIAGYELFTYLILQAVSY